ncbi:hypothetical protein AGMMS49982_04010 [Bacteroidia bacterium]|nr:hypothetical protein AGMMS49982_04010 [Bacteroidia bacterium]
MKIRFFLFVFGLILTAGDCFCQTENDSSYWEPYEPKKISITGYLSRNSINIESDEKRYVPNSPLNIGASLAVKNIILDLGYKLGLTLDKTKGKTQSLDIQLHQYGRHFLMDIFVQMYKGFYSQDDVSHKIEIYPNLSAWQVGAEGTYLCNGNKFSAKPFTQWQRQLKSVGSFVVGGGAYWSKIDLSDDMSVAEKKQLNNVQIGINAGYAYTRVINPHWQMSGVITAGLNFGNETDLLRNKEITIYPTGLLRGALGYHKADWGIALLVLAHNNSLYVSKNNPLNLTSLNVKIAYTKTFDIGRTQK